MALDLALEPQRQRGVMDACLSRNFDLLDVILVHDLLESQFNLLVSILIEVRLCYHIN